ncbi:hypothetical protein KDD30_05500 [Photobacterium sp. GJ3]|uniref:Ig-like domain-containing protein n=1 Tax=Photobacterium sp. GJ3 TaxID=2829502 RepID=UPI001B8D8FE3|nr:Ig-like domain-containing protein [Photobacterium sp. GJ3]QUJ68570.1 hypothetical protein KDD30_05500 [Photobacterium sp. GJ3]
MKYLISLILLCIATAMTGCNGSSDDGAGTENSAPNATPFSGVTQTETPLSGNLKADDPDGDALTFSLVSAPVQGSVQIQPDGRFTYTPSLGLPEMISSPSAFQTAKVRLSTPWSPSRSKSCN